MASRYSVENSPNCYPESEGNEAGVFEHRETEVKDSDLLLVDLVAQYPVLCNKQLKEYHNTLVRENCWVQIATILNRPAADCKKRWSQLRDSFAREKRRREEETRSGSGATKRKGFSLYNNMIFLERYIQNKRGSYTNVSPMLSATSPICTSLIPLNEGSFDVQTCRTQSPKTLMLPTTPCVTTLISASDANRPITSTTSSTVISHLNMSAISAITSTVTPQCNTPSSFAISSAASSHPDIPVMTHVLPKSTSTVTLPFGPPMSPPSTPTPSLRLSPPGDQTLTYCSKPTSGCSYFSNESCYDDAGIMLRYNNQSHMSTPPRTPTPLLSISQTSPFPSSTRSTETPQNSITSPLSPYSSCEDESLLSDANVNSPSSSVSDAHNISVKRRCLSRCESSSQASGSETNFSEVGNIAETVSLSKLTKPKACFNKEDQRKAKKVDPFEASFMSFTSVLQDHLMTKMNKKKEDKPVYSEQAFVNLIANELEKLNEVQRSAKKARLLQVLYE